MDFSGWFEVYLGGAWHTFDARHNAPRIGRVLMARGRDAADVAMTTMTAALLARLMVIGSWPPPRPGHQWSWFPVQRSRAFPWWVGHRDNFGHNHADVIGTCNWVLRCQLLTPSGQMPRKSDGFATKRDHRLRRHQ
jgi:hypothetical protein